MEDCNVILLGAPDRSHLLRFLGDMHVKVAGQPLVIGSDGPMVVVWPAWRPALQQLELECCGRLTFWSLEQIPLESLSCRHGNYWIRYF